MLVEVRNAPTKRPPRFGLGRYMSNRGIWSPFWLKVQMAVWLFGLAAAFTVWHPAVRPRGPGYRFARSPGSPAAHFRPIDRVSARPHAQPVWLLVERFDIEPFPDFSAK